MRNIAILGSTGSIGKQALEVIGDNPDRFSVEVLTAYNNFELLIKQARKFQPNVVVIGNEEKYDLVREALANDDIKVYAGSDALNQVVEMGSIDLVLTAMVGFAGLIPTLNAIKAGKQIALANKETLVVAGELVHRLAIENKVDLLPVDSEHSAIFQCLAGEYMNPVEKIILTCSGGPFYGMGEKLIAGITPEQALKHPQWTMGAKITIDSATMMNKGLEVIEAHWLFAIPAEKIDVVVHPQSIIHSMVEYIDGCVIAQLGAPDMRAPIAYALSWPERCESGIQKLDLAKIGTLTFEEPDMERFPALRLAFDALKAGRTCPAVLNAANEIAVAAFLDKKIRFTEIAETVDKTMQAHEAYTPVELDDYLHADRWARDTATKFIA